MAGQMKDGMNSVETEARLTKLKKNMANTQNYEPIYP